MGATVFLVTTTDRHAARNSSHLTKVRATTLYDPKDQEQFLLRPIGPGYNSLAHFNISDGVLNSRSQGIEGYGEFVYNSTKIAAGGKLTFTPGMYPAGNLGLKNGYLLTVDGSAKGWQICPGPLGENVVCMRDSGSLKLALTYSRFTTKLRVTSARIHSSTP